MTDRAEILHEMAAHEAALEQAYKTLDHIAARITNGALLSYPRPFTDPELFRRQEELTSKLAEIISRMQATHDELVRLARGSEPPAA